MESRVSYKDCEANTDVLGISASGFLRVPAMDADRLHSGRAGSPAAAPAGPLVRGAAGMRAGGEGEEDTFGFHVAGEFTISFICLAKAQRILWMASDILQTSISPDFLISLK